MNYKLWILVALLTVAILAGCSLDEDRLYTPANGLSSSLGETEEGSPNDESRVLFPGEPPSSNDGVNPPVEPPAVPATTFGLLPSGELSLAAKSFSLGSPTSVCERRNVTYVANAEYIFSIRDGRINLFAGNPRPQNARNFSHRLQINFSSSGYFSYPLRLLCAEEGLYVANPIYSRVLLFRDDESIEKIAEGLNFPSFIAKDTTGNLFILESPWIQSRSRLRKIDAQTKQMTTVPVEMAFLEGASALLGTSRGLVLANSASHSVFRIDGENGQVVRLAGTGSAGFGGDGTPAASAQLDSPSGVAEDSAGNLYVADKRNGRIRQLRLEGSDFVMETFAGPGTADAKAPSLWQNACFDNSLETVAARYLRMCAPGALGFDSEGSLLIADYSAGLLRKINRQGMASTVAGQRLELFSAPVEESAAQTSFSMITGLDFNSEGNIVFSEGSLNRLRLLDIATGKIKLFAQGPGFSSPTELRVLADGSTLSVQRGQVLRVRSNGSVEVAAGKLFGPQSDGIAAQEVILAPYGIALSPNGDFFVNDMYRARIHRVSAQDGRITRLLGPSGDVSSSRGYSGDGGPMNEATMSRPMGMDLKDNVLYVAENYNQIIRRIDLTTGKVSTIAGVKGLGKPGSEWADETVLRRPTSVRVASNGVIYFTESLAGKIRALHPVTQADGSLRYKISTVEGANGDSCRGVTKSDSGVACLAYPVALALRDNCNEAQGSITLGIAQTVGMLETGNTPSSIFILKQPCR